MSMAPEWQKQPFFRELLNALWHGEEDAEGNGTYAVGGSIAPATNQGSLLESIEVEGVGAIQLPLSAEDVPKLVNVCQQAPYGHGLATVVDTNVRRAWQVDASKVTFPSMPQFVTKTLQVLVNKAVHALGLHGEGLQVEGHLYKLLLYEAGGHFSRHRDTEKETSMFGTLVLQLPTQEGFEGGSLVVRHSGQTKTYDFSKDSSTRFFYAAFFADCEHELQKITSGTRLCLAFNLVRANDSLDMPLGELKGYSSRLDKVEATLRPWLEAATAEEFQGQLDRKLPSKLAIPLHHKYTMKTFSFAGLKGDDRLVAQVLQSCRDRSKNKSLELHLCILSKHQMGDPGTFDLKYRRRYYDRDDGEEAVHTHSIGEVFGERFYSVKWVGTSNKVCSFAISINLANEVAVYQDEGPFGHDAKPDEVEYEGNFGNEGLTMEYWYHKAMLVMWPRTNTFSLACKLGFSAVLDILESRLAEKSSDFSTLLHETLTYCKCNSGLLSQFPDRLLQLCVVGGSLEDVLCILRLLSDPLQGEAQAETASERAISMSVVISNANLTATIAKAVQKHGWEQCGADVEGLLKQPHVAVQGKHFGQLALELKKSGSSDAALLVAKRTLDLAFSAGSSLGELEEPLVLVMAELIFSFKECLEDFGLTFVNRLAEVDDTHILCSLVTQVYTFLSNNKHIIRQEFCREDDVDGASLFIRLCETVTRRDFHHPEEKSSTYVVDLVQIFHFLGIEQLFDKLIQAFVDQSRHYGRQLYLQTILLDADIIWEKLSGSTMGLQSLAEALIEQVAATEKPVFNWCMPFAKFPRDPAVEEFLRGPQSSLVYTEVSSLKDPWIFATKYFSGKCQKNYSATAEKGGTGASAYCKITKTRAVFEKSLLLWEEEQQEMVRLKTRIRTLQTTTAQVPGEVVVLFPDSSFHQDKKQNIKTTEYIDLKLDD